MVQFFPGRSPRPPRHNYLAMTRASSFLAIVRERALQPSLTFKYRFNCFIVFLRPPPTSETAHIQTGVALIVLSQLHAGHTRSRSIGNAACAPHSSHEAS